MGYIITNGLFSTKVIGRESRGLATLEHLLATIDNPVAPPTRQGTYL